MSCDSATKKILRLSKLFGRIEILIVNRSIILTSFKQGPHAMIVYFDEKKTNYYYHMLKYYSIKLI